MGRTLRQIRDDRYAKNEARYARVLRMRNAGMTFSEIGKHEGVTRSTANHFFTVAKLIVERDIQIHVECAVEMIRRIRANSGQRKSRQ